MSKIFRFSFASRLFTPLLKRSLDLFANAMYLINLWLFASPSCLKNLYFQSYGAVQSLYESKFIFNNPLFISRLNLKRFTFLLASIPSSEAGAENVFKLFIVSQIVSGPRFEYVHEYFKERSVPFSVPSQAKWKAFSGHKF